MMAPNTPPNRAHIRKAGAGRPTLHDVAAIAAVSAKTVSRVINEPEAVREETRTRVQAAIDMLGFRPNESARQLRKGKSKIIGLLLEDISDPFNGILTLAVQEVAYERGYTIIAASSEEDQGRAASIIDSFTALGASGIIVAPAPEMRVSLLDDAMAKGCAVVLVDRWLDVDNVDAVLADNFGGGYTGTKHLIAQGHTRIAFVGDRAEIYTAAQRHAGYLRALGEAGIAADPALMMRHTPVTASMSDLRQQILSHENPPTAIFSGNNRWTIRLLHELPGLRFQGTDLALVGFDDFELSNVVQPGVTVVAQDPRRMGRLAAEQVISRIDGNSGAPERIELPVEFITRGSGERAPQSR
ncbi:LacI family DNA-binding transcriptional regulator [Jonesiaceae bacterium BS-20]|uniref:LacI family DNA-binding transcriptional regulator n=1 Tax=Jonesiaceae bacterium BS-20 TaxID=3120821 RepID=A0AAU7DRS1_9MICO